MLNMFVLVKIAYFFIYLSLLLLKLSSISEMKKIYDDYFYDVGK